MRRKIEWISVILWIHILQITVTTHLYAQSFFKPSDTLNHKRIYTVAGYWTAIYGTALIGLNTAWYANYDRASFHFYNDSKEWLQMDKAGHFFTNYFEAKWTADALQWAGMKPRQAAIWGTATGLFFQTTLETLDAFSTEWGFSASDMAANTGGALLFLSQELLWKEQRIQVKFSTAFYQSPDYSSNCLCDVKNRENDLFGKSLAEQTLKNYNKQTYWFSFNIHSFIPDSKIPAWLNVAVGYGADGMLGGFENKWKSNNEVVDASHFPRVRQYYISPDIDLTKIKTHSHALKTALSIINVIKVPMPALMLNSQKQLRFYPVYF